MCIRIVCVALLDCAEVVQEMWDKCSKSVGLYTKGESTGNMRRETLKAVLPVVPAATTADQSR